MSDTTTQPKQGEMCTVNFIGKEFNIPAALDKYIKTLSFFEKIKDALNLKIRQIMIEKLSDDAVISIGSKEEIESLFKSEASKVIKQLCDYGIYSKTAEEYFNNKGYDLLCEINRRGQKKSLELLQEELNAFATGWKEAENRAESSISGSGINVYSGNFIPLAVAAVYNYSCTKSQFEKANKQYKDDLKRISSATSSSNQSKTIKYVDEVFLPDVEIAVSVFAFSMMDQYLTDIDFDEGVLQYTDYKKSKGLLENLKLSSDKKAVLEAAFVACPFNEAVYEQAAQLNLCDLETMKTALKYCPENTIAKRIAENCKIKNSNCNFSEEYTRIVSSLPIVALQMKVSEAEAAKALFEVPYNLYTNNFSALKNSATCSGKNRENFVSTYVARDPDELYSMTQEQVNEKVLAYASKLINHENYTFLVNLGFDFSKFCVNNIKLLPVSCLVDEITTAVVKYIPDCKMQREVFAKFETEYVTAMQEKKCAITELENSLVSLGVFAFTKKRELREKINKAKSDLETYRRQSDINGKKSSFEANYI